MIRESVSLFEQDIALLHSQNGSAEGWFLGLHVLFETDCKCIGNLG